MGENRENKETRWNDVECELKERSSLAKDVIKQMKTAFVVMAIIAGISIVGNIAQAIYTAYIMNSYEYVYQDSEGMNNINTGDQGDVIDGTTDEN